MILTGITGEDYSSYETDYNAAGQTTSIKLGGVTGQFYTGVEIDYTPGGPVERVLLSGIAGQSFSGDEPTITPTAICRRICSRGSSGRATRATRRSTPMPNRLVRGAVGVTGRLYRGNLRL